MALTFGKNSTRTSAASNPITTASFTIDSNEKLLVLMLKVNGATNRAGGSPTFGGQTMTQANSTQKAVTSPEASAELWYLLDPPTGANTASIPNTGLLTIFYTLATAKASSTTSGIVVLDGANGGNNTSTNPTPGAVVCTDYGGIGFAITAGGWTSWNGSPTGTLIANTDDGADGGGEQYFVVTNPGSKTLDWLFGTSDDWGAVAAFFKESKAAVRFNNYLGVDVGNGASAGEKIR